ncbi:MAG: class I SAM-dependent methyltransferase [Rhodocyclaceae bacterium]|nr:MAG: class I SAM-dependent methyltransferase [Rhodocyclaceae bacterium]
MESRLPEPSADAQAVSLQLTHLIADEIRARGGWISFARYWELALYTPGLGYYSGGSQKFGSADEGGDFVTAPELTPLFGQALARQVAQIMATSAPVVLEAGAGSGKLAADLLTALKTLGQTPERYLILELSGELRARQQSTIEALAPELLPLVQWLDALPERFSGCVVGNEVLDAMPVHRLYWSAEGLQELGVALDQSNDFVVASAPANATLHRAAAALPVEAPYRSEVGLAGRAWTAEWAQRLDKGALLLIDYGLPRHEYYHPQRDGGTIRCHYRHRTHDDPFWFLGLSDITAHVDFTAIAEAGFEAGLDVLGYTTQSAFLMNCGIAELLALRHRNDAPAAAVKASGALQLLMSPNEMGELFKVIALGRGIEEPLLGFSRGDRIHSL